MELHNIRGKGLTIVLNGKEYALRYDLNALSYLEKKFGLNFLQSTKDIGMRELKHLLRAGLLCNFDNDQYFEVEDYNKLKPTLAEIGRMVDMDSLMTLPEHIKMALEMAMPEAKEGEGENRQGEPK